MQCTHDSVTFGAGAGTFGHLSDSFLGRKGSLTIVCILNAIFGMLTTFSSSYYMYVLFRFLTGFSTGGVGLCAFVLATEPVGPSVRGSAGMSTFYFFSSGIALCSGIAFLFPSWRELYIASALPSILFVLVVIPFVSESPRWFLVRGRVNEAMEVMRAIARVNGRSLPDHVWLAVDKQEEDPKSDEVSNLKSDYSDHEIPLLNEKNDDDATEVTATSIIDVVKSPLTRIRLILAVAINLLCSVVYYGLSLNVVNLGTNLYLSVLLNAVAELPAYTLTAILLGKFGRKPLAISTMWFSGIFCLIGSFLWGDQARVKAVRLACGVLGIFGMAGTYNLLFIYTSELFPTVVRNAALGCATQAAQMGAILSPFVVVMGEQVPFAVFAGCGIVGGVLGFYLPETKDRPLYDTLNGMEDGERKENHPAILIHA
uniref:Major facilitator superfamily (MFS) profile domain-containing protein n=1 Tax=Kalanchoe fedtschenkoi TaxID=63787 RepID=A0A7N1A388_KALFE